MVYKSLRKINTPVLENVFLSQSLLATLQHWVFFSTLNNKERQIKCKMFGFPLPQTSLNIVT